MAGTRPRHQIRSLCEPAVADRTGGPGDVGDAVASGDRVDRVDDSAIIAELVVRARRGDRRAVSEIVDRCSPMVHGLARRYLNDPTEADDVAQEVWLRFTEHLHRIETPAATRAWLARVTTHTAWRAQRRANRTSPTSDLDDRASTDDTEETGLRHAGDAETRRVVRAALDRLAPPERHLVELLVADDRPDYRTVATLVGRPIGSIGPTRQRILARLRREPSLVGLTDQRVPA
jgi:RNA polymerase sigma factor (sigma-70 family)